MLVRFATPEEIQQWDTIILRNPDGGNVLQSSELGYVKESAGWTTRFVVTDLCAITIHERSILGLGNLWYIPKGPGVTTAAQIETLVPSLRQFANKNNVFLIKIEPEIISTAHDLTILSNLGLVQSAAIQLNASTVILDISKKPDVIMSDLPQKARHAIKRAQRDGVRTQLVESTDENFNIMLNLMSATMTGKSSRMRESAYYKKFWQLFTDNTLGALFFAYENDTPITGAFVLRFGTKATYKDGGSIQRKTIYGSSHALQWHIIEWLSGHNVTSYDLCGTPPSTEINNKSHRYYGIGLFKTSFNKTVIDYVGVYDIIVRPTKYKIWKSVGERITQRFYSTILHTYFY